MKLLIIKFCLIFSLLIQIKTDLCNQVVNPTKKKCNAASVTPNNYKCCYFEGKIDLVSKAEKVLMALSTLGDYSYTYTKERVFSGCISITKENYDDIDDYIDIYKKIEVDDERSQALALRWLVNYAKLRNGKGRAINLANEIMDAATGTGGAVKKREDTHKMAEANKAFAHYRW